MSDWLATAAQGLDTLGVFLGLAPSGMARLAAGAQHRGLLASLEQPQVFRCSATRDAEFASGRAYAYRCPKALEDELAGLLV